MVPNEITAWARLVKIGRRLRPDLAARFGASRRRDVGGFEEFGGLVTRDLGNALAADHFREFFDPRRAMDERDGGLGDAIIDALADGEVAVGITRYLRQVRDAQDLLMHGELAQFFADDRAKTAADVRVNLVEDQHADAVGLGEDSFEREHDAREFPARGDLAEGLL